MKADFALPAIIFLCLLILHILRARESRDKFISLSNLEIGAASSFGTRQIQQDYFGVKKNHDALLMLLADGTGENGEVASKLAIDTFRDLFSDPNSIDKPQYFFKRAANAAQHKISNTLEERQGETSLAAVIIKNAQLFYTLIGNCRVTIWRDGDLIPVSEGQTIDVLARHSYEEGRITKSETLALLDKHRQYNMIGQDAFQDIELFSKPLTLKKNDLVILMSEGVFNTLRWVDIESALTNKSPVQNLANDIIQLVKKSPIVDKDNATILICRQR